MDAIVKLYSDKYGEILKFLKSYSSYINIEGELLWEKHYENPIEMADIIGTFIENNDKYKINMWISIDKDLYINVNDNNADKIIRYLYERYPW